MRRAILPQLSIWMIRAALLHLVAGFTIGALMLAAKGGAPTGAVWRLLPAHMDLLMLGWMAQLAMGVAFWILPRLGRGRRGDVRPAWIGFLGVNAGVLLVVAHAGGVSAPGGLIWGRTLEMVGLLAFSVHLWPRIRSAGTARARSERTA